MCSARNGEEEGREALLGSLDNTTIRFATYILDHSPFVSIGRRIKILGPEVALRIADYGEGIAPDLVELLHDEERDWAANVILSSIAGRDAVIVSAYADAVPRWRKAQKQNDVAYWRKWLAKRGQ